MIVEIWQDREKRAEHQFPDATTARDVLQALDAGAHPEWDVLQQRDGHPADPILLQRAQPPAPDLLPLLRRLAALVRPRPAKLMEKL